MANIIKPKRTNTAGNTPTTANLASGEFGVNMADQKTYINNGTAVVQVGAGNLTGLGDVVITSPTNAQALIYNTATSKWINGAGGGGINSIIPITSPVDTAINISSGKLGLSFEPILINATGSITISSGQQWVIWPTKAVSAVTQNATTVSINETIANGFNGSSIGPITISSGSTLSVASDQLYIIF